MTSTYENISSKVECKSSVATDREKKSSGAQEVLGVVDVIKRCRGLSMLYTAQRCHFVYSCFLHSIYPLQFNYHQACDGAGGSCGS